MERNLKSRIILFALTALLVAALACNLPGSAPPDEELPAPAVEIETGEEQQSSESIAASESEPDVVEEIEEIVSEDPEGVLPAAVYFIGTDSQLWRLEVDGLTTSPVAADVIDFDVSPYDGRLVYVSGNDLYRLDTLDSEPVLLLDGPDVQDDVSGNFEEWVINAISFPLWSPDGSQIAFGWGGAQLISSNGGDPTLLQASDPPPDLESGDLPLGPIQFFFPEAWSPDGTKLIIEFRNEN